VSALGSAMTLSFAVTLVAAVLGWFLIGRIHRQPRPAEATAESAAPAPAPVEAH
jgi:hypothetical protein